MAGRPRTRKNDSKKTYKDVVTQTTPDKYTTEINRLKEEVNMLRQELVHLQQSQEINSDRQKLREEVTVVAVADSPQAQKVSLKGCNCKGKCASKVCGCVKRQAACTASCRCEHTKCKNQEPDKENNNGANNAQVQASLKLRKNISEQSAEGVVGPSRKQLKQVQKSGRGLFSPDSPETHRNEESLSQLQLNSPITFNGSEKADSSKVKRKSNPKSGINRLQKPAARDVESKSGESKSGKSKTGESKKKRLRSPYYDGRKASTFSSNIEDIDGFDSPAEDKEKVEKIDKVAVRTAVSSSGNLEQLEDQKNFDAEANFATIDPMKTTRQLQRTPVSASSLKQLRRSESPLQYTVEPVKVELAPPEDIDAPHVNWEKHCAQLVPCRFCKRTFYPYRLERHEATCKRI